MAKKILEFFPHQLAARKGGAYTYLYNLKKEITGKQEIEIVFLSDLVDFKETPSADKKKSSVKKVIKSFFPSKLLNGRRISKHLDNIKKAIDNDIEAIQFNDFDIIHFHEAVDLWRYEHLLENFNGKILFTPHSPIPYHLELLEEVFGLTKSGVSENTYSRLEKIDQKAFSMAQQIVLPCIEALDGYYSSWPIIESMIKNKQVHYVITGCPIVKPKKTKEEILKIHQIPQDSFIISFTGRHSLIKGYDELEKAAREIFESHPDIYFLVAGNTTGIEHLHHKNWIETGWTDDPAGLINASDVNVVANRETYFDLNILEAMSLARPIILTEAGGNRFLKMKINSAGLFFIGSADANKLAEKIEYCYQQKEQLASMGAENRIAYEQNFTAALFYKRYIELYKNL
jgi:glycosyltransferase involved in cell wall biosynthesis